MPYSTTSYQSPLGTVTLASDGHNLVGLWLDGQKYHGPAETMTKNDGLPVFGATKKWLDGYFAGREPGPAELPLAPGGSAFRQLVWAMLREIPRGQTMTYGALAKKTAAALNRRSMSSQAVGGAVGHNPISIIIPCHRVVGSNGSLTGYAGGLEAKRKLLALEGADLSRLYAPATGTAL